MISPTRSFSKLSSKPKVFFLDLYKSGLSAIERLCLEEALLRHDQRSWAIIGTHHPIYHSHLEKAHNNNTVKNENCAIIMGIGGKPDLLLDVEKVRKDGVLTVKRFSGGGTVVIDRSSLWTTFIGRNADFPSVDPYPRAIMEWSANDVFHPVFQRMKDDVLQNCRPEQVSDVPDFKLRENDYVLGPRKMGGNAQCIVKGGWLHHTSFLWDYNDENMEYLTLPQKRPAYRNDRDHNDFLVKLKTIYGTHKSDDDTRMLFFDHVKSVSHDAFDLEEVSVNEALGVVEELGGMQAWFEGKCRTKIVKI